MAHPVVSGNKIRKLEYLLPVLKSGSSLGVVSFGGIYSNHIHALAWLCKVYEVPLHLMVRAHTGLRKGEFSPTLRDVSNWGAEVHFLSPTDYRCHTQDDHLEYWQSRFPGYAIVPEGGSHGSALKGIGSMVSEVYDDLSHPDVWICPVGTGATLAGIVRHAQPDQLVLGISALKASNLDKNILHRWDLTSYPNWTVAHQWHFGGYGHVRTELIRFIHEFYQTTDILLDPLYNGKAMYALDQYISSRLITPQSRVVFLHTGGLQGWRGLNKDSEIPVD